MAAREKGVAHHQSRGVGDDFLNAVLSPITELRHFIAWADAHSAARRSKGVATNYIFYQVLLTQPLIHIMVVQKRGLDGSMGILNALMSWLVLLNLVLHYALLGLGYTRDQHDAQRPRLMAFVSAFYTLCTATVCGLAIYTRGTAPSCPQDYNLLDIQFCNTVLPGMMPFDNLAFHILLMVFNFESVPVPFAVTCLAMVLGYAFMLATTLATFDARFLPGSLICSLSYFSACWYIVSRTGPEGSQRIGTGSLPRDTDDSSLYSDFGGHNSPMGALRSYGVGFWTAASPRRGNGTRLGGSSLSKEEGPDTTAPVSWDEAAAMAVLVGAQRGRSAAVGGGSVDGRWEEAKREKQEDGCIRASKEDSFISDITNSDFSSL